MFKYVGLKLTRKNFMKEIKLRFGLRKVKKAWLVFGEEEEKVLRDKINMQEERMEMSKTFSFLFWILKRKKLTENSENLMLQETDREKEVCFYT